MASEVKDSLFPVTIITEAPDETIHGEDFIVAHTAQMRAVLAAVEEIAAVLPIVVGVDLLVPDDGVEYIARVLQTEHAGPARSSLASDVVRSGLPA